MLMLYRVLTPVPFCLLLAGSGLTLQLICGRHAPGILKLLPVCWLFLPLLFWGAPDLITLISALMGTAGSLLGMLLLLCRKISRY